MIFSQSTIIRGENNPKLVIHRKYFQKNKHNITALISLSFFIISILNTNKI